MTTNGCLAGSCLFSIPARTSAANIRIQVTMSLRGFYILPAGPLGGANASVIVEAQGWQYGHEWGMARQIIFDKGGDTMGRYDGNVVLDFLMPTGGDPFEVGVGAGLQLNVNGAGAAAKLDFESGRGNFIDTISVNTVEE